MCVLTSIFITFPVMRRYQSRACSRVSSAVVSGSSRRREREVLCDDDSDDDDRNSDSDIEDDHLIGMLKLMLWLTFR